MAKKMAKKASTKTKMSYGPPTGSSKKISKSVKSLGGGKPGYKGQK
jgi:hypothetical protein